MTESLDNIYQDMLLWRHDIHQHPELGFQEIKTADKVARLLQGFNIETHVGIGGTGVVGVIKKGASSHAIGLRADMDALPIQEKNNHAHKSWRDGVFHGCGHDGHIAMLLGAAKYLAEEADFNGTVYVIFQPSEENGLGALAMIKDGLFDRFPMEAIYGMHNMPGIPTGHFATRAGQMMTFEDNFAITITGKGGHASMPNRTIDPLVIGAEMVMSLQTIVSRAVGPEEWGVVSVTEFHTDGARNIIPSTVTIKGDCRGLDPLVQKKIENRMRQIVEGVALSHGAQAQLDYSQEFIVLVNSAQEVDNAVNAAINTVGADRVEGHCTTCSCSEDFAQFLQYIPGCFILIGNGDQDIDMPLHNPQYDYKDENLTIGSQYWVNLVQENLK